MAEPVVHNTFVVEKSLPYPVARVFQAFADPLKKRRWYGESPSHELVSYALDFRTGGSEHVEYRMGADTPFKGMSLVNDGRHLDIVPDARIVLCSSMSIGGRVMSCQLVTFQFLATAKGADLLCAHQGAFFENADGPEMRKRGWETLFSRLAGALQQA